MALFFCFFCLIVALQQRVIDYFMLISELCRLFSIKTTTSYNLERIWEEVIMTRVPSQHPPGGNKENHKIPLSR
jgi:hypothetical protein